MLPATYVLLLQRGARGDDNTVVLCVELVVGAVHGTPIGNLLLDVLVNGPAHGRRGFCRVRFLR